jgi:phage FluMu protein Com
MARREMRRALEDEIPIDGGTAVQLDPERPVFRGNGGDDYVCIECGTVLAASMPIQYMNRKVRIKCARCRTINVAVEEPGIDYAAAYRRPQ